MTFDSQSGHGSSNEEELTDKLLSSFDPRNDARDSRTIQEITGISIGHQSLLREKSDKESRQSLNRSTRE